MNSQPTFETAVPGKWILAGEHSVLRGSPALVFPLNSRLLQLRYFSHSKPVLNLILDGEHGDELELLFWGVLEKACSLIKISRSDLKGIVKLKSSIPVGAGLGASAALCVGLSRWFHSMKFIQESELYEFARNLENLFHGESSGVDIAVALSGQGLCFVREGERKILQMNWQPKWFVSYSGQRGVTSQCVNKVKSLIERDGTLGRQIDDDMRRAVALAQRALTSGEAPGFEMLTKSILLANSCFEKWGLTIEPHRNWLREQGAVAVKPTGSGDGGYLLSLWDREPSAEALKRLIPCL